MSKKETKKLLDDLKSGNAKVHTKTKEQIAIEEKELAERQRSAYLGAVILATATLYKFEELHELGATRMNTKYAVKKALKFLEQDVNGVFNILQPDKEGNMGANKMVEVGLVEIEKVLKETIAKFPPRDE